MKETNIVNFLHIVVWSSIMVIYSYELIHNNKISHLIFIDIYSKYTISNSKKE